MKVARYYSKDDVRIEEMPVPVPGPGDILVRVTVCGICGSDVMAWYADKKAPTVLGHEPAGVVEAVGAGVTAFKPGHRVFMHHHVPCFVCHYCRRGLYSLCNTFRETHLDPGGFAEYVRAPALNVERDVLTLPDDMSDETASFIEPLGTVIHAVTRARLQPGDSVAIIGSGPMGLLFTQLVRLWGGLRLTVLDKLDWRLSFASRFGAERTVNIEREDAATVVRAMNDGRGADIVFICAHTLEASKLGVQLAARGGTVLIFAPPPPDERLAFSPTTVMFSELSIIGSYSTVPGETRLALELLRDGRIRVEEMITHRLPLQDLKLGLDMTREAQKSLKVLIEMPEGSAQR